MSWLFDSNGRCIPHENVKGAVATPDKRFYFTWTPTEIFDVFFNLFNANTFDPLAHYFKSRINVLTNRLLSNRRTACSLHAIHLPLLIPPLGDTISVALRKCYEALKEHLKNIGSARFYFHLFSSVTSTYSTTNRIIGRQNRLLKREQPLAGIWLPEALRGFSIQAAREQIEFLPPGFLLCGLEAFIAVSSFPWLLTSAIEKRWYESIHTPNIFMPAIELIDDRTGERCIPVISSNEEQIDVGVHGVSDEPLPRATIGLLYIGDEEEGEE